MRTRTIFLALATVLLYPCAPAQWVQTKGPFCGYISSFAVSDNFLFAGGCAGVYATADSGTNWTFVSNGLPFTTSNVTALAASGVRLFAGTGYYMGGDGIFLSTDGGSSWRGASAGLPQPSSTVNALAFAGANLLAGIEGRGVFHTTDFGTNWGQSGLQNPDVRTFVVCGNYLFAGTYYDGLFLSTDNGANWLAANNGLPRDSVTGRYFAVLSLARNSFNLLAGTLGRGVYSSSNNGTSWTVANNGLPGTMVDSLPNVSATAFAVSDGITFAAINSLGRRSIGLGVYLSTDGGTSWTTAGMTDEPISALAVSETNLFAGTFSGAVWRRPLSEMITSMDPITTELQTEFLLSQNFPNPFNPSTTIRYGLPARSQVTLAVFNALGQQVAQLVNGDMEAGYHEVQYDASGLSSGIYFYRLQAGAFVETRKLLLVR